MATEHRATIVWNRRGTEFTYKEYTRDHLWKFEGGSEVAASAMPKYLGNEALVDPEQAFVAALSSCHMLTFLAIAARDGFIVNEYHDAAVGYMERNDDKKLAITRVVLKPEIVYEGQEPTKEELDKLHATAHAHCFIANSVTTKIEIGY